MATKKYKVAVDPGHGGYDDGAVKYVTEDKVNLVEALACRDYLQAHGVEVLMSRTTDTTNSLRDFCKKANDWGADLAVSIHNKQAAATASRPITTTAAAPARPWPQISRQRSRR